MRGVCLFSAVFLSLALCAFGTDLVYFGNDQVGNVIAADKPLTAEIRDFEIRARGFGHGLFPGMNRFPRSVVIDVIDPTNGQAEIQWKNWLERIRAERAAAAAAEAEWGRARREEQGRRWADPLLPMPTSHPEHTEIAFSDTPRPARSGMRFDTSSLVFGPGANQTQDPGHPAGESWSSGMGGSRPSAFETPSRGGLESPEPQFAFRAEEKPVSKDNPAPEELPKIPICYLSSGGDCYHSISDCSVSLTSLRPVFRTRDVPTRLRACKNCWKGLPLELGEG